MSRRRLTLPLSFLLLSGCVGHRIDAPSLEQRSFERDAVPVPDEAREPGSTLDAALKAKLDALLAEAQSANAAFATAERRTDAAVARAAGTAAGSESWTVAQQELSVLDASHGPLQTIEAEIDALRGDPANATPANRDAIDAAAARVETLADQQRVAVSALSARLK